MDADALNMQIRKFLKEVGVTSQREIEQAVAAAESAGKLPKGRPVAMQMTLRVEGLDLEHRVDGELRIE